MIKDLILLFGGLEPSLPHFTLQTKHLTEQELTVWTKNIFRISLYQWSEANAEYKDFLVNWIIAHRQEFVKFYHKETVMGQLGYPVNDAETLILFLKLWREYEPGVNAPARHMMFMSSLWFKLPFSLKTLCNLIAGKRIDPADLLDIYARARIGMAG